MTLRRARGLRVGCEWDVRTGEGVGVAGEGKGGLFGERSSTFLPCLAFDYEILLRGRWVRIVIFKSSELAER